MADSPPRRNPRLEVAATAPDLLSSLPLEVLDKILCRLDIYDVVRTAALSRAWRRRWESLPTVDLTRTRGLVATYVDALFLRRTASVRTFRLAAFDDSWYVDALHDWILHLSRNGVQNLFLWFPPVKFRLHSSLFACRELTNLNLTSCRLPPAPPGFTGFPSLKSLLLDKVAISEHGGRELAALIGGSPFIEVVKLVSVELIGDNPDDEWVIRAPNLRVLTIASGLPYGGRIEHLPLLRSVGLNGCNFAKFLMATRQVTKLEFATASNWPTEVDVLDRLPFLFENLRSLVISVDFRKMTHILSLFCLLRSAPLLEELNVLRWSDYDETQEFNADDDFFNAQWADGTFAKLKVVQIKNIACTCNEMHLIDFILSKARVLQVLSVRFASDSLCTDKAIVSIKQYSRASPDAQVIFLDSKSANISSIDTSTKNAEVEGAQAAGSRYDSMSTSTENTEAEEAEAMGSRRGSVNTFTENDVVNRTRTSSSGHEAMDTSTENAQVEEAETADSRRVSVHTFTENAVVDETLTSSNSHDSIGTPEDAEVEEAKTPGTGLGSVSTFTENAGVDEIQTTGSGLVYDVHPWRRRRLDMESVAQLEELQESKIELQRQIQMEVECKRQQLQQSMESLYSFIRQRKIMKLALKDLSEHISVTLPPFPKLSSAMSSLLGLLMRLLQRTMA